MRRPPTRLLRATSVAITLAVTTGCAPSSGGTPPVSASGVELPTAATRAAAAAPVVSVGEPGRLRGPLQRADLVVVGRGALPRDVRRRIAVTDGVAATLPLAMAAAPVADQMVTVAAVDPTTYRRFTPATTARTHAVWQRVADGDLAISPELAESLRQRLGEDLTLGNSAGSITLRVGAKASMTPMIDAVVNDIRGGQLGMVPNNAVLVSTGASDPGVVAEELRRHLGERATVTLTESVPEEGRQTAFLAGGSVAEAVGSFEYRYDRDGTVEPDAAWVSANIRTESVPILGSVTCHRVMLPQLRGALEDVVDAGLADRLEPGDFGGCYAPRFIARDPERGLSLHTWGIAVDLNVQSNLRGSPGDLDRRVVEIFKRWGFAWGGDWSYTDPMHFELVTLGRPR